MSSATADWCRSTNTLISLPSVGESSTTGGRDGGEDSRICINRPGIAGIKHLAGGAAKVFPYYFRKIRPFRADFMAPHRLAGVSFPEHLRFAEVQPQALLAEAPLRFVLLIFLPRRDVSPGNSRRPWLASAAAHLSPAPRVAAKGSNWRSRKLSSTKLRCFCRAHELAGEGTRGILRRGALGAQCAPPKQLSSHKLAPAKRPGAYKRPRDYSAGEAAGAWGLSPALRIKS